MESITKNNNIDQLLYYCEALTNRMRDAHDVSDVICVYMAVTKILNPAY